MPPEWRAAEKDQFSAAAFAAGPDDRPVRITVTRTPAAMGLEVQLNRWRGQIQLPDLTAEDWKQELSSLKMGDAEAVFVKMDGETESIAGAIAPVDGMMWFFKMRGPTPTVDEELDRLKEFCGSVRFDGE